MKDCPTCHGSGQVANGFRLTGAVQPLLAVRRTERDERTIQAVDIPRKHALDFGVVCGLLTGAGCAIADVPPSDCVFAGIITGSIVGGAIRAVTSIADWRTFVWRLESATGIDIDDDDQIGEPQPPPRAPDAWIKTPTNVHKARWSKYEIPFTNYEEARRVARAVLVRGVSFSRQALVDAGAMPDHPTHYQAIYRAMTGAEMIKKSGNKNVLTDVGRQYLADCMAPPPDANSR